MGTGSTLFPRESPLNGKQCWDLWWKQKMSLDKTARQLEIEGKVSPRTGKRYTPTAIRYNAWLWALRGENHQEAYKDVRDALAQKGRILSIEEWKKIMVENASFVWGQTPKKIEKFILESHLEEYR